MVTPALNQSEIFCLFPDENPGLSLLYSPLAGNAVLADNPLITRAEQLCLNHPGSPVTDETLRPLLDFIPVKERNPIASNPAQLSSLTILPNEICNLNCSYCYAAAGRSKQRLDREVLLGAIRNFISIHGQNNRQLYISFGGGGEPFLSWELIKESVEVASDLSDKLGIETGFSFATNGTLLNREMLSLIRKYQIKANVSFDILPDVQQAQRGRYEEVSRNLHRMSAAGIFPTINAVITPLNVHRQEEMAIALISNFPDIRRASFDFVVDAGLFADPVALGAFLDDYYRYFVRARAVAKAAGVEISSIELAKAASLRARGCSGSLALTAEGKYSICFAVSSPASPLYPEFIIGQAGTEGKALIDQDLFRHHLDDNVLENKKCHSCFAKWHCGGGCHFRNSTYSDAHLEEVCRITRKMVKRGLLEKAESQIHNLYGKSLTELNPEEVSGMLIKMNG
ncbi:radical SAM additional 4Fe4S-binding SPASM domain [Lentimicrobium saccharophilum]|uniref:Radical SAM additional 4Fe4S-binding SPASM domain n=1 Tax=Lentimicrobium saccharophilum TaxID=1678841 RepID=A0A0S7BZ23_9BACT|nr:radical SAM protein [Lentimicrobium saccharophilum]GAP43783.1 radical SAM additional 4Fe4S-binding SPASM domain [Lentimicrobium saccharophilum]